MEPKVPEPGGSVRMWRLKEESCRALGCADLSCTYSKYF